MGTKALDRIGDANPELRKLIDHLADGGATADAIAKELYKKGVDVSRGAVVNWLRDRT